MASIWKRTFSHSNIHEYQDPEISEIPKIIGEKSLTSTLSPPPQQQLKAQIPATTSDQQLLEPKRSKSSTFYWQRLCDVGGIGEPIKEYFRVEEPRPATSGTNDRKAYNSCAKEATQLRAVTPAYPLQEGVASYQFVGEGNRVTEIPNKQRQSVKEGLPTSSSSNVDVTTFEDMQRKRRNWAYKYTI